MKRWQLRVRKTTPTSHPTLPLPRTTAATGKRSALASSLPLGSKFALSARFVRAAFAHTPAHPSSRTPSISTEAQFAGTCVGVFLIVVMIESVRRWGREWDRYILQQAALKRSAARQAALAAAARSASPSDKLAMEGSEQSHEPVGAGAAGAATNNNNNRNLARFERAFFGAPVGSAGAKVLASHGARFRPTVLQQLVRSLVYAVQFAGAVSRRAPSLRRFVCLICSSRADMSRALSTFACNSTCKLPAQAILFWDKHAAHSEIADHAYALFPIHRHRP